MESISLTFSENDRLREELGLPPLRAGGGVDKSPQAAIAEEDEGDEGGKSADDGHDGKIGTNPYSLAQDDGLGSGLRFGDMDGSYRDQGDYQYGQESNQGQGASSGFLEEEEGSNEAETDRAPREGRVSRWPDQTAQEGTTVDSVIPSFAVPKRDEDRNQEIHTTAAFDKDSKSSDGDLSWGDEIYEEMYRLEQQLSGPSSTGAAVGMAEGISDVDKSVDMNVDTALNAPENERAAGEVTENGGDDGKELFLYFTKDGVASTTGVKEAVVPAPRARNAVVETTSSMPSSGFAANPAPVKSKGRPFIRTSLFSLRKKEEETGPDVFEDEHQNEQAKKSTKPRTSVEAGKVSSLVQLEGGDYRPREDNPLVQVETAADEKGSSSASSPPSGLAPNSAPVTTEGRPSIRTSLFSLRKKEEETGPDVFEDEHQNEQAKKSMKPRTLVEAGKVSSLVQLEGGDYRPREDNPLVQVETAADEKGSTSASSPPSGLAPNSAPVTTEGRPSIPAPLYSLKKIDDYVFGDEHEERVQRRADVPWWKLGGILKGRSRNQHSILPQTDRDNSISASHSPRIVANALSTRRKVWPTIGRSFYSSTKIEDTQVADDQEMMSTEADINGNNVTVVDELDMLGHSTGTNSSNEGKPKRSFLGNLGTNKKWKWGVSSIIISVILALFVYLAIVGRRRVRSREPITSAFVLAGDRINGPDRTFTYGPGTNSNFGASVSLDGSGARIAIGSPDYAASIFSRGEGYGMAQVYEEKYGEWVMMVPEILGEFSGDAAGKSVALSADGKTLAVGSPGFIESSIGGQVKLYRENEGFWEELGTGLVGDDAFDRFGTSVALSDDGSRVAVSAPAGDNIGRKTVEVYELDGDGWPQLGGDLVGRYGADPVAMAGTGDVVALGSLSTADNNYASAVRVYHYERMEQEWARRGSDISLGSSGLTHNINWMPSLSADGNTLAIGSSVEIANGMSTNDEHELKVYVYRYNKSKDEWARDGEEVYSKRGRNLLRLSASLSADGKTLAIGDPSGQPSDEGGYVHILRLLDDEWVDVETIKDGLDEAQVGFDVSLSADGKRVGIGAPRAAISGEEVGQTVVYKQSETEPT